MESIEIIADPSQAVTEIRSQLSDVNLVSFSGGKDSTTVLQLVLYAMTGDNRKLYIVTSDTLMEIPYFQGYVDRTKAKIAEYISANGINAELVTVRPAIKDSFWVSVLGKGYPAAHMGFRWCTGKLKIDPITKFTKNVTAACHGYKIFMGVRRAESDLRARIYQKKDYKPHHFAPILDWTAHDVWEFLLSQSAPWGDHSELVTVYRYSSDECVYGEKQGVCVGNARYGCWACPLQTVSQLEMIGYHTADPRYKKLKRFKIMLVSLANRTGVRSRIRRNGEDGVGPFLVSIRKRLFNELKRTEADTGWKLITPEEESCIREHWKTDAEIHNIPDPKQPLLWNVCCEESPCPVNPP